MHNLFKVSLILIVFESSFEDPFEDLFEEELLLMISFELEWLFESSARTFTATDNTVASGRGGATIIAVGDSVEAVGASV